MSENTSALVGAMTEQTILDKAEQLLAELQKAMTVFTDTIDQLAKHDVDNSSHLDIRESIQGIVSGEGLITREDAVTAIKEAIDEHNSSATSHATLTQQLDSMRTSLTTLTQRVEKLEPTPPDDGMTELEKKLKAIDDYYDPTLKALMDAWNVAKMNNTGTADAIAAEYQKLSQEKAKAIADALREYTYA